MFIIIMISIILFLNSISCTSETFLNTLLNLRDTNIKENSEGGQIKPAQYRRTIDLEDEIRDQEKLLAKVLNVNQDKDDDAYLCNNICRRCRYYEL